MIEFAVHATLDANFHPPGRQTRNRQASILAYHNAALDHSRRISRTESTRKTMSLSPQTISLDVLQTKYCKNSEQHPEDVQRRVAQALAAIEPKAKRARYESLFFHGQRNGIVMGGRINSAAGTDLQATLINCFVQPVADSISETDEYGQPGIYEALREATETMRRGGGVGYDFSSIRPRGAYVKGTDSNASGPISYMQVFDQSCATVESAGARRGAQMGILRIDHPDILEFIHAKDQPGQLTNFNLSIGVTDEFMQAVKDDAQFTLVHEKPPRNHQATDPNKPNDSSPWIYDRIPARRLWDEIMRSTYDHGEPGVFFLDHVEANNNLRYCEQISACNPCSEQVLPAYGCCCLGSINLTRFVTDPFTDTAAFSFDAFEEHAGIATRMLDNVLDATTWPLKQQHDEAMAKRRIGLGFLGLGSTLMMLGIRYDSDEARELAALITQRMRDSAYRASIELAKERGPFPKFDPEAYLASQFVQSLPEALRCDIATHGIRNSHLLSIAPTGTISLAFADNASNGIEPAYALSYDRRRRTCEGEWQTYPVYDHAYRLWCERERRNVDDADPAVPIHFVTALEISAADHARMVTTIQPYIDSSISKTVNVPEDYPFDSFQDLYMEAWLKGAKSLATFRPNPITGSILSLKNTSAPRPKHEPDLDRRIVISQLPNPTLNSLRWPKRPLFENGNRAHCYRIKHPHGAKFALFIGEIDDRTPFEIWMNGSEAPRGLQALAINLSYDMYTRDRGWLKKKLNSLIRCKADGEGFALPMPPNGTTRYAPSLVAAMAMLIEHRCHELNTFDDIDETPVLDALMSPKEPKAGPNGTLSWTVDIHNPSTGDDLVLGLKEARITIDGIEQLRPYSVWLSNDYPKTLDGLCKSLSLDMRVVDPAWAARKLRKLLDHGERQGDFWATIPGREEQKRYPSTIAYIARLIIHRFSMHGILTDDGFPIHPMGIVSTPSSTPDRTTAPKIAGALCLACGQHAVIRADGCDRCTYCGELGACG